MKMTTCSMSLSVPCLGLAANAWAMTASVVAPKALSPSPAAAPRRSASRRVIPWCMYSPFLGFSRLRPGEATLSGGCVRRILLHDREDLLDALTRWRARPARHPGDPHLIAPIAAVIPGMAEAQVEGRDDEQV